MRSFRDAYPRCSIVLAVALGLMVVSSTTAAQQRMSNHTNAGTEAKRALSPTVAGDRASDIEALRLVIRRLEARIAELEARLENVDERTARNEREVARTETTAARVTDELRQWKKHEAESRPLLNFFKRTEIRGSIDGYYAFNVNRPALAVVDDLAGTGNQLYPFAHAHNQFTLNLAKFTIERTPDRQSPIGFTLDLAFGPAAEVVHAAEPGGDGIFRHVQQAYVSYLAPIGHGLKLDFGKFVTPIGAEVIESQDNWNYSRGLLFSWAIPFYHFGARATYQWDTVSLSGFLLNGWNNVVDNNSGKTFAVQVAWQPHPRFQWVQNYMAGPENAGDRHNVRHLVDSIVTYKATDQLSLMLNYDYGMDRLLDGSRVFWTGWAAYARYALTPRWALASRLEWFNDHDGFATGVAQRVKEFTLTSEFRLHRHLITKFEIRSDWSDREFFRNGGGSAKRSQLVSLIGLAITFGSNEDR